MNGGMIRFILGSVLKVESALLLFPCIVAVFIENPQVTGFCLQQCLFCVRISPGKKETSQYSILFEGRMCHHSHVLDYDQSGGMSAILFVW